MTVVHSAVNREAKFRLLPCQPLKDYMLLYKITNKLDGKAYIGQTNRSIEKRWREHCKPALKSRSYLSAAIQKYGKENFCIETLLTADTQEELDLLEDRLINEHNTFSPNGYNLKSGGRGGCLGLEAREKVRKANLGRINSVITRKKISEANMGRVIVQTRKPIIGINIKTGKELHLSCAGDGTALGFDHTCIAKCAIGKRKSHKGFVWKYNMPSKLT